MTSQLFARQALLPDGLGRDVSITIDGGVITDIAVDSEPGTATRLPGVVLPGLANAHSHAFHRALRGRTHVDGTFWTWREAMYAVADLLDPDRYLELARAVYAEMVLAGITTVGEFHYLHHGPGGRPYADPNAMAEALRQAAEEAGLRITLLDTAYLAGGLDTSGYQPLLGVQRRFGDGDANSWGDRVARLRASAGFRVGAAIHSVRAVPADQLSVVSVLAAAGLGGSSAPSPLHVHLSEQPAENEAAQALHGRTPTGLLEAAGVLGPMTTAVHATHVTDQDVADLAARQVTACICPTTERDLADGIGPAGRLTAAGVRLSLGSDQHAVIDMFEEARGLEMGERVRSGRRGHFAPDQLLTAMTAHTSLGWPDAGSIAIGQRADLVAVRTDSVRTAGASPEQIMLAATAADIDTVYTDGVRVVHEGRHRLGDVGSLLQQAVREVVES